MELSSHLDFEKIAIKSTLHGKNITATTKKTTTTNLRKCPSPDNSGGDCEKIKLN